MDVADLLGEAFGRLPAIIRGAVDRLSPDQLVARPASEANSIGWLIWHLARVQDAQVAELIDQDQVWITGDWAGRFGLTADPANTGYAHEPADVASVQPESAAALIEYYEAVAARTATYLATLAPADLDAVVDEGWDPPVTLGARLVSVLSDDLQHAGQASYVRGLLESGASS